MILAGIYLVLQIIGLLIVAEPTEDELNAMKEKALPITGDLKGSYACIVIIDSQGYWLYSS